MKNIFIIYLLVIIACDNREHVNPLDEETNLDPDEWAPSDLFAELIDIGTIQLIWTDNSSFESAFIIERSIDNGDFNEIAVVDSNLTEFIDNDINFESVYQYRIRGFTEFHESSNIISNIINAIVPAPSNLITEIVGNGNIKLNWLDNCSFESGYRIEKSDNGTNFIVIAEIGADVVAYTDTGLSYGSDNIYVYRVSTFSDNYQSLYSNLSTVDFNYEGPVWYISNLGSNDYNGSEEYPFLSIDYALQKSNDGDIIIFDSGVYDVYEALHINNRTIASRFYYNKDPSIIKSTILNGLTTDFLIQLKNISSIIGLTINNQNGSGIRITESPNIKYCIINNFDPSWSFAISVDGDSPNIWNCNISNAFIGISVDQLGSTPSINNCIIYKNWAGVRNWTYSNGNETQQNIFYSLLFENNNDIYDGGSNVSNDFIFSYCLFEDANFNNPNEYDFSLQSNSPCINMGNPDLDGDGQNYSIDPDDRDPDGSRLDIGALFYN